MEGLLGGYTTTARESTNVLGVNLLGVRLGGLVGKSLAPPLALSLKSAVWSQKSKVYSQLLSAESKVSPSAGSSPF